MACGLGVPFVEDIDDPKLLFILAVKAIVVIVDSDKANIFVTFLKFLPMS